MCRPFNNPLLDHVDKSIRILFKDCELGQIVEINEMMTNIIRIGKPMNNNNVSGNLDSPTE